MTSDFEQRLRTLREHARAAHSSAKWLWRGPGAALLSAKWLQIGPRAVLPSTKWLRSAPREILSSAKRLQSGPGAALSSAKWLQRRPGAALVSTRCPWSSQEQCFRDPSGAGAINRRVPACSVFEPKQRYLWCLNSTATLYAVILNLWCLNSTATLYAVILKQNNGSCGA